MKERIVIDKINNNDFEHICHFSQKEDMKYKVEQVPETFEELKELCKDIKGNKEDCGGTMWFEFPVLNNSKVWLGKALAVDQKGQVGIVEQTWKEDNFSITILAQNRTPQQMWQIIKSLIGEE